MPSKAYDLKRQEWLNTLIGTDSGKNGLSDAIYTQPPSQGSTKAEIELQKRNKNRFIT